MRRAPNLDRNQPEIVAVLRAHGASVQSLAQMGQGVPDLLVGYRGRTFVLEVKDGEAPPSRQRLTPDEEKWHQSWRGQVVVVRSADEALEAIGVKK